MTIKDCTVALRLKSDPDVHLTRGQAYIQNGEYDLSIKDSTVAIRLRPDDVRGYLNRGIAHIFKGEADLAIKDLKEAIRLKPDLAEARAALSKARALKAKE